MGQAFGFGWRVVLGGIACTILLPGVIRALHDRMVEPPQGRIGRPALGLAEAAASGRWSLIGRTAMATTPAEQG